MTRPSTSGDQDKINLTSVHFYSTIVRHCITRLYAFLPIRSLALALPSPTHQPTLRKVKMETQTKPMGIMGCQSFGESNSLVG